jgi:hypothetical protein
LVFPVQHFFAAAACGAHPIEQFTGTDFECLVGDCIEIELHLPCFISNGNQHNLVVPCAVQGTYHAARDLE